MPRNTRACAQYYIDYTIYFSKRIVPRCCILHERTNERTAQRLRWSGVLIATFIVFSFSVYSRCVVVIRLNSTFCVSVCCVCCSLIARSLHPASTTNASRSRAGGASARAGWINRMCDSAHIECVVDPRSNNSTSRTRQQHQKHENTRLLLLHTTGNGILIWQETH